MTEAELVEYYDQTRDVSEFDEGAAYPVEVGRNVTISVRFSDEEISVLRAQAEKAGLKVSALIRAAALQDARSGRPDGVEGDPQEGVGGRGPSGTSTEERRAPAELANIFEQFDHSRQVEDSDAGGS